MQAVRTDPSGAVRHEQGLVAAPESELTAAGRGGTYAVATAAGSATDGGPVAVAAAADSANLTESLARVASRIGAITGTFAGLLALFYVIGGAVMWIRFHSSGLPADEAVALVPRDQLLVVGLRVLVLPALLSGLVFLLLAQRHRRRQLARPTWRSVPRRASLCWL